MLDWQYYLLCNFLDGYLRLFYRFQIEALIDLACFPEFVHLLDKGCDVYPLIPIRLKHFVPYYFKELEGVPGAVIMLLELVDPFLHFGLQKCLLLTTRSARTDDEELIRVKAIDVLVASLNRKGILNAIEAFQIPGDIFKEYASKAENIGRTRNHTVR